MKRPPMEWEKIFVNVVTERRLISKIYQQLNIRKATPSKKWAEDLNRHWAEDLNRHFSKEDI